MFNVEMKCKWYPINKYDFTKWSPRTNMPLYAVMGVWTFDLISYVKIADRVFEVVVFFFFSVFDVDIHYKSLQ